MPTNLALGYLERILCARRDRPTARKAKAAKRLPTPVAEEAGLRAQAHDHRQIAGAAKTQMPQVEHRWHKGLTIALSIRMCRCENGNESRRASDPPVCNGSCRTSQPRESKHIAAVATARKPRRRKLHTQQRLPDGGLGPARRRLWKRRHSEPIGLFYNIRLHRLAWRDVVPFDPVILFDHARMAFEVNSVRGRRRSCLACRAGRSVPSAREQPDGRRSRCPGSRHSRVTSSTMLSTRKRQPPANWSCTKSNQRAFGFASTGSAPACRRLVVAPDACEPSDLPRDRDGRYG